MKKQSYKNQPSPPVVLKAVAHQTRRRVPNISKGFALIASLLIMSLLALLAFGMLSLSRVTHTTRQKKSLFY